jgi:hypothetical protein
VVPIFENTIKTARMSRGGFGHQVHVTLVESDRGIWMGSGMIEPPHVDHLDVVGRLTPSMNGNQEFKAPRSLVSQAWPSHWDVCSC